MIYLVALTDIALVAIVLNEIRLGFKEYRREWK